MTSKRKIKFDRKDLFLQELRTNVMAKIKANNDHVYASKWDHLKLLSFILGMLGLYTVFLHTNNPFIRLPITAALAFSGILMVVAAGHDASHFRMFRKKKWNKLIMRPLFLVLGLDGHLWGLRHVRSHHPETNIPGSDCDADTSDLVRMSPNQEWKSHHRYQLFYTPFLYCLIFLQAIWVRDYHRLNEKTIKAMLAYKSSKLGIVLFVLTKIFHLSFWILFPVYYMDMNFLSHIGYYIFALAFASLSFICLAALNHYSEDIPFPSPDENNHMNVPWSEHQMSVNVDWESHNNKLVFWLGGANTHVGHHLMPEVHSRHLGIVTEELKKLCEKYPHYDYKNYTFMGAVKAHFALLHNLSLNPNKFELTSGINKDHVWQR